MPLYEHVFLARQDASSQQVDDLTNQFKAIVAKLAAEQPDAKKNGSKK